MPGKTFKQGDAIKNGATIRLQHMKTRKWLHSHLHASPISGNLEVCIPSSAKLGCKRSVLRVFFKTIGHYRQLLQGCWFRELVVCGFWSSVPVSICSCILFIANPFSFFRLAALEMIQIPILEITGSNNTDSYFIFDLII